MKDSPRPAQAAKGMNICICGWYFYKEFIAGLVKANAKYPVHIVCNQEGDCQGLPSSSRKNVGLDWGAYQYYLLYIWDRHSPVLFMQDDTQIHSQVGFDKVAAFTESQAFIFSTGVEASYNSYAHGRAFYMKPVALHLLLAHGGFWYDKHNTGFIAKGGYRTETPPKGCQHHNAGIHRFSNFIKKLEREGYSEGNLAVNKLEYVPEFTFGRRGKF